MQFLKHLHCITRPGPFRSSLFPVVHLGGRLYSTTNHYSVLGVSRNATKADIKSAFVALSKKYHPDKTPKTETKIANERFSRINEAYSVLIDPAKRREYDRELDTDYVTSRAYHSGVQREDKFDLYRYNPRTNSYTYRRAYGYQDFGESSWEEVKMDSPAEVKRKNNRVLQWLVVFCICGAALHSLRIHYTHKLYNRRSIEKTRKLQADYEAVIMSGNQSTIEQQLEILRRKMELDMERKRTRTRKTKD